MLKITLVQLDKPAIQIFDKNSPTNRQFSDYISTDVTHHTMDVDWASIVFTEAFNQRIHQIAKRKFIIDAAGAEEAVTYTIASLSDNNWQKCRAYKGNSSPETFLYKLSVNLMNDYIRKLSGRPRPPTWLKQKGALWVALWKEHCLNRDPIETLLARHTAGGLRDRHLVTDIISSIKAKLPWCGVSTAPIAIDDASQPGLDAHLSDSSTTNPDIDDKAAFDEALEFAHLLLGDAEKSLENIELNTMKSIQLTAEEKLVLKMHFCDAMGFSAIARSLGLAKHQPVRLIQSALDKAREHLIKSGIELDRANFG